jgi:acetyltransferase
MEQARRGVAVPTDTTADLLGGGARHPLEPFFSPRSVAVIGATERPGAVGRKVMWNLITSPFGGTVFPVNPESAPVLGVKAYASVAAIAEPIDLGVIVTPAETVPAAVRECAAAGVRAAIVVAGGFRERGPAGSLLEEETIRIARDAHMRLLGPNSLGMMCPQTGLNATFAGAMARKGDVAFLSQSGALQTAILDWSLQAKVGFSAFASVGSMLDVGWGDLIDYLGSDGRTKSILIYMESVGDARAFLSAAREVALQKPIIVLKGGRTEPAARAVVSHSGNLSGSDEVLTAAFRRTGVLRVDSIADLFFMADTLTKQPRPRGRRLGIVTNAGGPGVLATDALVSGGGEPAAFSGEALSRLDAILPAPFPHGNPIDLLGDADPERYAKALEIVGDDAGVDGLLVILAPQDATEPGPTAERLKPYARGRFDKPILASWMGSGEVAEGRDILSDSGIPCFWYPDTAARIFNYMWKYSYNLRGLYETPALSEERAGAHGEADAFLRSARAAGRTVLTEFESKRVLAAYGIPVVETRFASTADEAVHEAQALGWPVVLKLSSRTIAHKSEVGGVRLDLPDAQAVRDAFQAIRACVTADSFDGVTVQPFVRERGYELIVGSSVDPQFGPVLLFGSGGVLVEAFKDRSLALPPLNTTLARRTMEHTRIHPVLARGRVDLGELEKLLVRFSQLVLEQPAIREIDVNPLLASAERLLALDARIVLHGREVPPERLPRSAIRPYPIEYVGTAKLRGGETVTIRPIRPEDEPKMVKFHGTLSEESVYNRYAGLLKLDTRVVHDRLSRLCFLDYDRQMALVAEREGEIVAVARLVRLSGIRAAEFALLISDVVQRQGLGTALLDRLLQVGRDWGLDRIVAEILPGNVAMRQVCRRLGFVFDGQTGATKDLR